MYLTSTPIQMKTRPSLAEAPCWACTWLQRILQITYVSALEESYTILFAGLD